MRRFVLFVFCLFMGPWEKVPAFAAENPSEKALIDTIPSRLRASVMSGRNSEDLTPYINHALEKGGTFELGGYTYLIKGRLLPAANTNLVGTGEFLAAKTFDDIASHDGLNMMIRIADGLTIGRGITFDGNLITRPGFWLTGARNTGPVSNVTLDATFRNLSFDGIDISRNNGAWRNAKVEVHAAISNVGWAGANLEGILGLNHDGLIVERTGWHGIYVGYSEDVHGDRFSVDKARPPYRVYDGPGGFGGVERGFLFGHFSTHHAYWTHFRLFDNRHSGYDGFGIGEDGPQGDSESSDIHAQGEIWYAGLFGFDVSSDMTADVKIFHPTRQGVQFGLDLGGTLENSHVKAMVVDNLEDEAARFSATGTAARFVSMNSGSNVVRIESGEGFSVVPGQIAKGTGIVRGTRVAKVDGNLVTLDHAVLETHSSAHPGSVTFRGTILFRDCTLQLDAQGARFGVGIESDEDGFSAYQHVAVSGDLSTASIASVRRLNGRLPAGLLLNARLNEVAPFQ